MSEETFRWLENQEEDSSEDEKYIPSEELIEGLKMLIEKIQAGTYTESTLQDIYESIEMFINPNSSPLDPKMVSYLFRGWWISDILEKMESPDFSREDFERCPFCLEEK